MNRAACILLGLISLSVWPLYAAQQTNESFSTGVNNGWVGTLTDTGNWRFTNGVAQLTFSPVLIPGPTAGMISNNTSAAFTGNYEAADINLIGFNYITATGSIPSEVVLSFGGNSNVYNATFSPSQTGVWYSFSAPLTDDPADGGWILVSGYYTNFAAVRRDVKFVAITIKRAGVSNEIHRIDNILLGRQPSAVALAVTETNAALAWIDLKTNQLYHVEATRDILSEPWQFLESFTATSSVYIANYADTNTPRFLRMVIP